MAFANLRPGGIGAQNGWILGAGADKVVAVDPGATLIHDDTSTYIWEQTGNPEQAFTILASSIPSPLVSVIRMKVGYRARYDGGDGKRLQVVYRLGGFSSTDSPGTVLTGSFADYKVELARPNGGLWTPSDITSSGLTFGVIGDSLNGTDDMLVTSLWLELEYVAITASIQGFREVASRDLRWRRLPSGLIEVHWPTLEPLDFELLDLGNISHPDLPSEDGLGAGVKPWQRWPVVIISMQPDWENGETILHVRDVRDYLCCWWDTGKSFKASTEYADGIARLDAGNTRLWTRASKKWVRSPGDKLVQLGIDGEANDADGELFESASTNEIIESAFKNGAGDTFTGWTKVGTGSNGSNIVSSTSDLLWDPASTSVLRAPFFNAGSPVIHAADMYLQSTATASFLANTVVRASIWRRDRTNTNAPNGAPLSYAIQRSFDSQWWRDSDQTWQASLTWNQMPVTTVRARHKSKQINVGANATTLTVRVGIPTTGTRGQENWLYHVQVEQKRFVTSAVLTETTIVSRSADKLSISNGPNAPAWPPDRGTWRCKVQPHWSAADVATENKTVVYVAHDADNYDWLYFDGANARWVYERKAAGVTYRATKSHSPVADTVYVIAARWTSSMAEWDWPAYTLSLFVWEDES